MPRFISLIRVDEKTAPAAPSAGLMERMGELMEEMTRAGVLLDTGGLGPIDSSKRVRWSEGRTTVLDGPFTEAKEVVGGYSLVQTKDLDEAVEWAKRFVQLHEEEYDLDCEVRQVFGSSDD
ncbi:YciI family protein [Streptomyces sp. NBC_00859]|uniref:YciI family protein n=1 Tax=Streptomyces sp. NBC_00859 TaxID=2903682 RepID=UPI00386C345F|nr:YciI family protein [Streptomyces sp. NBC_00859]